MAKKKKESDDFAHVCPRLLDVIRGLQIDGHKIESRRLDHSEIHFPPELHLTMSGRLTRKSLTLIKDDCSGQVHHNLKEQWLGCWCCLIRFTRRQPKSR